MAKTSNKPSPGVGGVAIPYAPPSHVVRAQTGQMLPSTVGGWVQGLAGATVGAGIPAILIGFMPTDRKWLGALIGLSVGAVLTVTSPVASFAQEIGIGSFAPSAFWFILDATGQICVSS